MTDSVSRLSNNGTQGAAILWTLVYVLLALVLLAATLATFNRCLGRVSNHSPIFPAAAVATAAGPHPTPLRPFSARK